MSDTKQDENEFYPERLADFERWLSEQCRRAEHDWDNSGMTSKYDRGFWDALSMVDEWFAVQLRADGRTVSHHVGGEP